MKTASWVIVHNKSGEVICETFDRNKAGLINLSETYSVIPILDWLVNLNKEVKHERTKGERNDY